MKITADVLVTQTEKDNALFSEEDWDNLIYHDITIKFAQELRKMNPLFFKEEEMDRTHYQAQAIVISMVAFKEIMVHLEDWLPRELFEVIRNQFNNTI